MHERFCPNVIKVGLLVKKLSYWDMLWVEGGGAGTTPKIILENQLKFWMDQSLIAYQVWFR